MQMFPMYICFKTSCCTLKMYFMLHIKNVLNLYLAKIKIKRTRAAVNTS